MSLAVLPTLNAILNATSALLLLTGFFFIRAKQISRHAVFMLAALSVSALFLVSYLTYHAHVGSVPFRGTGWARPVYFTILITHTMLAIVIVPRWSMSTNRTLWVIGSRVDVGSSSMANWKPSWQSR